MRSSLKTTLSVMALAAALPALAFAQKAVEAPYAFLEAIASADLDALSAALAADPELAESLDPSGSSAVFLAFDSPDPAGVLAVFLEHGLSPFHEDEDNERTLMSQAVWYGDAEAARVLAVEMKKSPPRKWAPVLDETLRLMESYENMSSARIAAIAAMAIAQGVDEDYILERITIMVEGRTRYPEVRKAIKSVLSLPPLVMLGAAGGAGPLFVPNDTDAEPALAAGFGAEAAILFPMGEITEGFGGAAVPFWSAGFYAAFRGALSDQLDMYAITAGLELDMIHFLYFRIGGGYALASTESMSFSYTGYSESDSLELTLPGGVMDIGMGMRFFVGSLVISVECPITFRLFEALSESEHPVYSDIYGGGLDKTLSSVGIMLGVGYSF